MRYERGGSPAVVKKVCVLIILKTEVMELAFPIHRIHLSFNVFFFNFAEKVTTWSRQRKVLTWSVIWLLWNKLLWISVEMYCISTGTAEGEELVGPRPHHFFAPQPPLFENQILWFYSFFRFSIWKNYFQLSALPLFTLLRGPWSIWQYYCCTNHTMLHACSHRTIRRLHKLPLTPNSYSSQSYKKTFY